MRIRGDVFWDWADQTLHHRTHDETLDDGTFIDVQVRLSRTGSTQMFIGVYAPQGMAVHEEAFDSRPGESMTRAWHGALGVPDGYPSNMLPPETALYQNKAECLCSPR